MNPQAKIVARLTAVFGEPRSENPELFVEEFVKALQPFSGDVLELAGDDIIRASTFWPKPHEVYDIARRIAVAKARPVVSKEYRRDMPPPTPEQAERAAALVAEMKRNIAANIIPQEQTKPWYDTSRPAFERMQRESPNQELHRKPRALSEISRRMSGDDA